MRQSKTTLKELTAAYRAVLRYGILCNAIALGLAVATPAKAGVINPDTTNNVFVLGDISLDDQHVANGEAAFAGRRMNVWTEAGYRNDFPKYKMVARSFDMSNSDTYVGPVTLTLRDVSNDAFAFNYQDSVNGDWTDVNLANLSPAITWNVAEDTLTTAGIPQPTAHTIAMFAHLDGEDEGAHAAGSMNFDNVTAVVDGATINAETIDVKNNSELTFVKQDTALLDTAADNGKWFIAKGTDPEDEATYGKPLYIDSDGKTTLNADTINITGSHMTVNNGAELTINAGEKAVIQNATSNGNGGALNVIGSLNIGENTTFKNNKASGAMGGAIYMNTKIADGVYSNGVANISGAKFESNTGSYIGGAIFLHDGEMNISNTKFDSNSADYGGAMYTASRNTIALTIEDSEFTNNTAKGSGAVGAMANVSVSNTKFLNNSATQDADGGGALFVGSIANTSIGGNSVSESLFQGNTSVSRGGAISMRNFAQSGGGNNVDAKLDIVNTRFISNSAGTTGGAIDNFMYGSSAEGHADAVYVENSQFTSNSAAKGGAIYNHAGGEGDQLNAGARQVGNMYLTDSTFTGNTASDKGGAIYNEGTLALNNAAFNGNNVVATNIQTTAIGGAIANVGGTISSITDTTFDGNYMTSGVTSINGGAIYNSGGTISSIDAIFKNNYLENTGTTSGSSSALGGAVYTSGNISSIDGSFDNNSATSVIGQAQGGALWQGSSYGSTINDLNADFTNNRVVSTDGKVMGGAVFTDKKLYNVIGDFKNNKAISTNNEAYGGAIYNAGTVELTVSGSKFESNSASGTRALGGAVYLHYNKGMTLTDTKFENNSVTGTTGDALGGAAYALYTMNVNNSDFNGNKATTQSGAARGGALYNNNGGTVLTDSSFTNNSVTGATAEGGAIYLNSNIAINAVNKDVVFSGNKANGVDNDIYNNGKVLNLSAADGKTISLAGGINGSAGALNITGAGLVDVSNTLKNQTVNVNNGELHLNDVDLTGSTVAVDNGATLNLLDNKINNYTGITLANGANVKADFGLADGSRDAFTSGGDVTLTGFGITSDSDIAEKSVAVAASGSTVTVADGLKTYTTNAVYTVAKDDTEGNGYKVVFTKDTESAHGLKAAVVDTGATGQVVYSLTDTDTSIDENVVVASADMLIKGAGKTAEEKIALNNELAVAEGTALTLKDANFTGTGALKINAGAETAVEDSTVDVAMNNSGETTVTRSTLAKKVTNTGKMTVLHSDVGDVDNYGAYVSDPTTYTGTFTNVGAASFDADTFTSTAVLDNSNLANLTGGVTFAPGAKITGTGTTNLLSGTTHFNNTESSNTINLAKNADFDGTLVNGAKLSTQNSSIDAVSGSVSGGDLYVDAKLGTTNIIDSFAGNTGTIKEINILGTEYGTADSVELTIGGADLDSNVQINGMNYYTDVKKQGNKLVFSDKLINRSTLDADLGKFATAGEAVVHGANITDGTVALDKLATLDLSQFNNTNSGFITKSVDDLANYTTTSDLNTALGLKANAADVYTKTATDDLLAGKIDTSAIAGDVTIGGDTETSAAQVMSTKAFQNSIGGFLDSQNTWGSVQGFNEGIKIADAKNITFKVDGGSDQTLSAADVATFKGYATSKQDALSEAQLAAVNSGITGDLVTSYNSVVSAVNNETTGLAATRTLASNNQTAINTLNGDEGAAGSVKTIAKGYADGAKTYAKDYADTLASNYTTTSDLNTLLNAKLDVTSAANTYALKTDFNSGGASLYSAHALYNNINGENGKSLLFNETDGGGAKFTHDDGTLSFVGVNNGGQNGLAAQIYATTASSNPVNQGARIDVSTGGMYYTVGHDTLENRMVKANEIVTRSTAVEGSYDSSANYDDDTIGAAIAANASDIATLTSGKADKSTTLAGYGITDAYTKGEIDTTLGSYATTEAMNTALDLKANANDVYTKTATNDLLATKANAATTLAGYGITDAYTKDEIDTTLGSYATTASDTYALKTDFNSGGASLYSAHALYNNIVGENGKALLFNETDGGGAMFTGTDNSRSFVGVHDGSAGLNVGAQIYALNASSSGSRLNVNQEGIYYVKGAAGQGNPEGREVATLDDIASRAANATYNDTTIGGAIAANATSIATNADAIALLNNNVDTSGSVLNSIKTTAKNATYDGDVTLGEAIAANATNIATNATNITTLQGQMTTLNGDENTDGSVANSIATALSGYATTASDTYALKTDFNSGGASLYSAHALYNNLAGTNGKALLFNETDGGGAKFEHTDGTWSFAGVNDGGANGIAAQIYAIDSTSTGGAAKQGARIDVTTGGMYYTVGNAAASDRLVEANEIVTRSTAVEGSYDSSANYAANTIGGAIAKLNGTVGTEGSVLNSIQANAANATYDNASSGLTATTLQGAIDEIVTAQGTSLSGKQDTLIAGNGINIASDGKTISVAAADSTITVDSDGIKVGTIGIDNISADAIQSASDTATYTNTRLASAGYVDEAIVNALAAPATPGSSGGVIAEAIAEATTMNSNSGSGSSQTTPTTYTNFESDATVIEAVAALDTNIGKVHQLITQDSSTGPKTYNGTNATASKNVNNSGNYVGNLAVGTTIEDHLVSLDNAIGSLSSLNESNGVLDSSASVATNLNNLDAAIKSLSVSSGGAYAIEQANAYTDERVEKLDKNLSSGIASAIALTSVSASGVQKGEVAVSGGYGYYNGQSAAAFGAAMGLSNRWSVNAGAGVSNSDVSFRAGTTYKFKMF